MHTYGALPQYHAYMHHIMHTLAGHQPTTHAFTHNVARTHTHAYITHTYECM